MLLGFRGRVAVGLWVRARTGEMGRRSGPGVSGGQVAVGGLGRRRERRSKVERGGERRVWGGRVRVRVVVGVEGSVDPRTKLVLLVDAGGKLVGGERGGESW